MSRFILLSSVLAACALPQEEALQSLPDTVDSTPSERPDGPDDTDDGMELPEEMTTTAGVGHEGTAPFQVYFEYLTPLGDDYVYEGWLIVDGEAITAGRFQSGGNTTYEVFDLPANVVNNASLYVLTIEPAVGDDPAPSDTHVLAGAFRGDGLAYVNVDHGAALGTDFTDADGGFFLQTPSTANIAEDYYKGIWFIDPAAGPGAGLDLPTLPAGWQYEGWLFYNGYAISTGTFLDPAGADSDAGGPYAGPDGTPPFPGQDFIDPSIDLAGFQVAISVEPVPDNSPSPYGILPLQDGRIDDLGPAVFEAMTNTAWYVPAGAVAR